MNIIKFISKLLISLLLIALYACGSGESDTAESTAESKATTELPSGLQKLVFNSGGTLNAYIIIDGDRANRIKMTIDTTGSGSASVSIPGLSRGVHHIIIRYEYTLGTATYGLAIAGKSIDLSSGPASLGFFSADYSLDVFDYDGDGINNAAELKAGTAAGNNADTVAPVFSSNGSVSVIENTTVTGYSAVAVDAGGDTVTYSLTGGADKSLFSIDSSGALSFNAPADFEVPVDSDADNTYVLGVIATDGINPVIQNITVTVTNKVESFSITPQYKSVQLNWNENAADSYNLYYSTDKGFDINNYSSFNNGSLLTNVKAPLTVSKLANGTAYYFVLEVVYGAQKVLSAETASRPNELAFNGIVYAMATAPDGTLYLGGNFTSVGVATGGGVPVSTITGKPVMGDFPLVNGVVYTSVSDGAGGWYIGGSFNSVGGIARNNLAYIQADGSVDAKWNPNANNIVYTLVSSADGTTLYAGGKFTNISGNPRINLAAIALKDGSLSTTWDPNKDKPNNNENVYALAVSVDGKKVYVGGQFTAIGVNPITNLAAITTNNGSLIKWDPNAGNTNTGESVHAVEISGDGTRVYVGGQFTQMGTASRNYLAEINALDGTLTAWSPGADSAVKTLTISASGKSVYVGGWFINIVDQAGNTKKRRYLAEIAADGSLTSWDPDANNVVEKLLVSSDKSTVYVAGGFTAIAGKARNSLAEIGVDGNNLTLTNWNPNTGRRAMALAVYGSSIYVGGAIATIGGSVRNRLAAIDKNGKLTSWDPNADSSVSTLVVSADGNAIYAGGYFTRFYDKAGVTYKTRKFITAIGTDGKPTDWDPNANGNVYALLVSGSTVFAGGRFTTIGGSTRNYLAALDTGGNATGWDPNSGTPNAGEYIFTLAISVDGSTVYAGGVFSKIGTDLRNNLAAIDAAKGSVLPWNPDMNDNVITLAVSADGKTVYAGGSFTTVGGVARKNPAAINVSDGKSSVWDPKANTLVRTLLVSGVDKTVYMGGNFTYFTNSNVLLRRKYLAAINALDGQPSNWDPNVNNFVYILAFSADSKKVYVGGDFTTVSGLARGNFAVIGTDGVLK